MTGAAEEGRGFRRTGETGEKGFKAAESEGRRCRGRYSFGGGGGTEEAKLPGGCALSFMVLDQWRTVMGGGGKWGLVERGKG